MTHSFCLRTIPDKSNPKIVQIPHRNLTTSACSVLEITCSGISGKRLLRASNICPLCPFLSVAIKNFASTMYKAFYVPFYNVSYMISEGKAKDRLGRKYPQWNFHRPFRPTSDSTRTAHNIVARDTSSDNQVPIDNISILKEQ